MLKKILILSLIFFNINQNILADNGSIVNFTTTERDYAYEDIIKATLSLEQDGRDPADLQKFINTEMNEALAIAKTFGKVETSTDHYNVYQNSTPTPQKNGTTKETTWHGSQQILLKSKSTEDLLNLASKLQSRGLLMQDLTFALSSEASEKIKDELLAKTIKKLQDKALLLAKLLDKKNVKILELNIDNTVPQPLFMNKALLLGSNGRIDNAEATPSAQPTKVEVNLTVTAKILID